MQKIASCSALMAR